MFRGGDDYPSTWYAATTVPRQRRRATPPPAEADVVIVGGGFFGLYCALLLAQAGRRVALLEASRLGWGASGRNGGQLVPGLSCGWSRLRAAIGASLTAEMQRESQRALRQIRALIAARAIDCELADGHVEVAVLERRVRALRDAIDEARRDWGDTRLRFIERAELGAYVDSPRYRAGLFDPDAAHLHPLKYLFGVADAAEAAGATLHEGCRVSRWHEAGDGVRVQLADGATLRCAQLVLAAGAYIDRVEPRLAARVLPVGSFIGVTAPLGEAACRRLLPGNHAVYDNQFILEYFRTTGDHRLLFGGRCTYLGGTPRRLADAMHANIVRAFPQLRGVRVDYAWGGHIDVTLRRMPDWGRRGERVYWAQGFCGHGMVPTRIAANLVVEAMLGEPARLDAFAAIVNPRFPGGERVGALLQALGMSWYRLRDLI